MRGRRFVRSNSAILLVTCAIALAAPEARAESNKTGEAPNVTSGQLMGTWKGCNVKVLKAPRETAAIRDDGDHVEDHRAGVRRYEMQP